MFSTTYIVLFLLAYFTIFYTISKLAKSYSATHIGYFVANRNAGVIESSLGLVGCWLTGFSFFVGPQQAFNNGWVGYFYFVIPQMIGMLLLGALTLIISKKMPNGFTISMWVQENYGRSVGTLFQMIFIVTGLGILATTFTVIFKYIKFLNISNGMLITGMIVIGTVLYSFRGGIKTSLISGGAQTILTIVIIGILIYMGMEFIPDKEIANFLTGKKHIVDLFDPTLLITFGYTAFLTLITGPILSATHHQKIFSQQNKKPWKAWVWAAPGFLLVETGIALLGVLTLAWGGVVLDSGITQLFFFKAVGVTAIALIGIVLLNISCVAIDAHGNAIANIIANDFIKNKEKSINIARWVMVGIAMYTWIIASCRLDLTYIFFTYSIIRVNLFFILIMILTTHWLNSRGIIWSNMIMIPITVYVALQGMINKDPILIVIAVSAAMFATPVVAYTISKIKGKP